jgi:hypothetical protein
MLEKSEILDLSIFLVVLSGKNKKIGFYFSDKRSIEKISLLFYLLFPHFEIS